ncbi:Rhodanese-like domain protein [Lactococcus lactis subsp. lactis]|nr:Rhodanese-like domain protein [Lactococcus lactis subsp. lactis]
MTYIPLGVYNYYKSNNQEVKMQTIDISELELLTESENPVIVDVREDF